MGSIAARQHLAIEQQGVTGFPARHFSGGECVQVNFLALDVVGSPSHVGPQIQAWRINVGGAAAIQHKVGVACGGAVGDHGHWFAGGMGGVHLDLDIQHGGQAAQTLGTYAQCIHFFMQLQPHFLYLAQRLTFGSFGLQLVHVQVVHQAFLGHQHGFFSGTTNADAQHAGWAPASTHGGNGFQHPVHHAVTRVEHDHLALVFRAAPFGCNSHFNRVAGYDFREDDCWRVVFGVFALKLRVGHHAGTQRVVWVVVALAHPFVDGIVQTATEAFPAHIHAHLQENVHDTGVLTNGTVASGAHLAVGQDLGDGIFGCCALFALVRASQMGDVIGWVVIADVLQGGGNGFNQVGLANGGHGEHVFGLGKWCEGHDSMPYIGEIVGVATSRNQSVVCKSLP